MIVFTRQHPLIKSHPGSIIPEKLPTIDFVVVVVPFYAVLPGVVVAVVSYCLERQRSAPNSSLAV